ncbi:MAG: HYR domain-containing protein, partial [Flavobacteriales bacterium]
GNNTITFTATDVNGNVSTGTTTLTIVDDMDPVVMGQDITVALNTDGNAIITAADVDNGSSDNCSFDLSIDMTDFDCTNVGGNTVTLTGVDAAGNTASTTVTVTIEDNTAPVAMTQDITVELDAAGNATITPSMVNQGSADNCTAVNLFLNTSTFDCSDIGANTVTLTVTDGNNNLASATATVTVVDNMAPVVALQAQTVVLDASGNAVVSATDFNNGTADNCGITSMTIDMTAFDCSHVGNNTITFTATDVNGNVSTGTTTLTVVDNTTPTVNAQNITVALNASGNATIDVDDINLGSFDNCSSLDLSLDMTFFDCTNIGANTVTLTGVDANGNEVSATSTVTIVDNTNPVAVAQDVTIELDANGNASITTGMIDNGSSDNCSGLSFLLSKTDFDCGDVGANNIFFTAEDAEGNIHQTSATVTVVDNMAPMLSLQTDTAYIGGVALNAANLVESSSDNCGITSTVISGNMFGCDDLGLNTVTVTVTDDNGNQTSESIHVTVLDTVAPKWLPGNNNQADVTITSCSDVGVVYNYTEPKASDNCSNPNILNGILIEGLPSGSVFPVGTTTIRHQVTDPSGNTVTTTAFTVTVNQAGGGLPTDLAESVSMSMCEEADPVTLSSEATFDTNVDGVEESNGEYTFNPALAGAGLHVLTWSFDDGSGCEATTGTVSITVSPGAIEPVINQTETYELTAVDAAYATYQWYKNGVLLVGETLQTLEITTVGNYQVWVHSNDGCGNYNDEPYNVGGGVWDQIGDGSGKVSSLDIETVLYPNPTSGLVTIDFGYDVESVSIDVVDVRGAKVKSFNTTDFAASTLELDLSELPSAMYNVIIVTGDKVTRKKIVIN